VKWEVRLGGVRGQGGPVCNTERAVRDPDSALGGLNRILYKVAANNVNY
jgi:hypothetical protein